MAADALGTPAPAATPTVGVVSDEDHRLAMAGMIAPQSSTLAVRTGVLWGPGTTTLVTGTSATGTMTYSIAVHHEVTTRGTADGIYLGPTLDAATTVTTTAAPGSNSRIDVIWGKQNDTASTVSADTGSTAPLYGVANGTAAVSPVAPSIPVGAIELARATVAAGATSTNGAGVTITQTAVQTVARGAAVPVRSQAERDALTPFDMLEVKRLDTGLYETYWSGAWRSSTPDQSWTVLAAGAPTFDYAPPLNAWGDLTGISGSVTVPTGRTFDVRFRVPSMTFTGIGYAQLLIGGVMKDLAKYQTTTGTLVVPGRLDASVVGTGASIAVKVQGQLGSGTFNIRGETLMSPILEYRIH